MTVPTVATYSAAAIIAANTSFKTLVDAGSAAGKIKIRDSADVLLSTVLLTDPSGTVNGTTGVFTLGIAGPDTSAAATGTAAYGELTDSDNTVLLALPAQSGSSAVAGKIVINSLSIVIGGTVTVISATIT